MFIETINKKIEDGRSISWDCFKELKGCVSNRQELDFYDMISFIQFFQQLYSSSNIEKDKIATFQIKNDIKIDAENMLNREIDMEELKSCIKKLKTGKAPAEDQVLNEFAKSANNEVLTAYLKVFNECLNHGHYPWNTAVVTPIHKKGDIYDPNNYRAIAVGSCIGKLFSSILLERLHKFRAENAPNPSNQLGFCAEARTVDHILTMDTCIQKYAKKHRKKLFSCFIDFKKAFDTVCREALIYKLNLIGVKGKFLEVLSHMYRNSKAKIKLLNRSSEVIDINVGTEQGHPMSPELFKIYLLDLSAKLNGDADKLCLPSLNNNTVSHLLWADDLILLALDERSLQHLLDLLAEFCNEWGLQVNLSKTEVMVFNTTGRILKCSENFVFDGTKLKSSKEYTYLGITLSLTGAYKSAILHLRSKALRGYFSMRKIVDWRYLKRFSLLKLTDMLIKPILMYGCEIWLPYLTGNYMVDIMDSNNSCLHEKTVSMLGTLPFEQMYLQMMKWIFGVNKKTANAAIYGDTGRYPLSIVCSKQLIDYFQRVTATKDNSDILAIVKDAVIERKTLGLDWFTRTESVIKKYKESVDASSKAEVMTSELLGKSVRSKMQDKFVELWNIERRKNRKLEFYNLIKSQYKEEDYLKLTQKHYEQARSIAKIRMSAHPLHIETGRYKGTPRNLRYCKACCTTDEVTATLLSALPFNEMPVETELHALLECTAYNDLRDSTPPSLYEAIKPEVWNLFNNDDLTHKLATFLGKLLNRRQTINSIPSNN